MSLPLRAFSGFAIIAILLVLVGITQSWNVALAMANLGIISAIMALGVNIQWGYAGLFNVGIMGFAALGGMAAVLVSRDPVATAWAAGGANLGLALVVFAAVVALVTYLVRTMKKGVAKNLSVTLAIIIGYFAIRYFYDPAVNAIEADDPASSGFLGGLGLPITLSWFVGGVFAAGAAWLIGKVALGLRSDYLAIATLGISEILIAMMKNEDWLTRGVKNVTGLDRPVTVPYEVDLQVSDTFIGWVEWWNASALSAVSGDERIALLKNLVIEQSSIFVKLSYMSLFLAVLLVILALCVFALASPWGRMVRAIRDNEVSAAAMGKNVKRRHLQIFVLGSAVVGIAGAMLTTLDGAFFPTSYQPLRYTFLIWVMVIVGGSGNNLGSVLGAFLIWFIWIQAEYVGPLAMEWAVSSLDPASPIRAHLLDSAQHMRLFIMGIVMLTVMRFSPGGLLPERLALHKRV
ncbi:branched-chain amino acid ABC transporter permease [Ahrensia sp. R2A130]|uniref:branched-chain amino acid ABC transporter permease n=1 Tax=Ahrensia sp. R2A130 TaxID=744979 RepID=UPI0001E09C11|nr:branched-chain amino acid ABC transporter permease [Ahrensia sp. R2A130]EFL90608.1 inner-membrane translocator [Ahrensia sp. R2A130]